MITFNGQAPSRQPTGLNEYVAPVQTDQLAIDGSAQRNRFGQKKQAVVSWDALNPSDYQAVLSIVDTASPVTYSNDNSNRGTFAFTGLTTVTEGDYIKGNTLMRSLQVSFREV